MPRKKKVLPKKSLSKQKSRATASKVIHHQTPRRGITSYAKRNIFWAESYTSLLMGVVVVIVAVLFAVSLAKQARHIQDTTSSSIGPSVTPAITAQQSLPRSYTVAQGDDLWHIAEKAYGSGYNWVDIAQANNLSNPSQIFTGNVLKLPNVTEKLPTTDMTNVPSPLGQVMQQEQAIKSNTYTVTQGDSLWDIAVRAYADGYRWVDIARANNLTNPNLIFSGNVLMIPR